jgi:hypothetical protein
VRLLSSDQPNRFDSTYLISTTRGPGKPGTPYRVSDCLRHVTTVHRDPHRTFSIKSVRHSSSSFYNDSHLVNRRSRSSRVDRSSKVVDGRSIFASTARARIAIVDVDVDDPPSITRERRSTNHDRLK